MVKKAAKTERDIQAAKLDVIRPPRTFLATVSAVEKSKI